ncbi:hypothetical protein DE146DRAFT_761902 [Phaeosphaeria sp. MPI-PUGE-AT-0046c]|nr:hypothetical protein DE146DRAFT_761902 [Phaeosphaeria sp. MPI-PUGE-AT-0046c]
MTPNKSTHDPETEHHIHRAHIFDSTFWAVLPAHYDKIKKRWTLIARLYHEANSALMATDRAAGVNSLTAELDMLESDIEDYREVARTIALEDLIGLYMVAGRQRWRAEQIAKQDVEELEGSLKLLEAKLREVKADVVYGFDEKK